MKLLLLFSLVAVAIAENYDDLVQRSKKGYAFPCYLAIVCQYNDKPEAALFNKCIAETPEKDLDVLANNLGISQQDEKGQGPVEALNNVFCELPTDEQRKRYENNLNGTNGVLSFFKSDCESKHGKQLCQNIKKLTVCHFQTIEQLHNEGKC